MHSIILEANIKTLANTRINKEDYEKPGVWALYGRKHNGPWECLEVAKTTDIYDEIKSAVYILITPDDEECKNCNKKYCARRRFEEYSAKFCIHKCKKCSHTSSLRTKSWKRNPRYIDKYKDMIKRKYTYFKFVCVNISDDMHKDKRRKEVEAQYAIKNRALYWCG